MTRPLYYLLAGLVLAAGISGCRSSRPAPTAELPPVEVAPAAPDTTHITPVPAPTRGGRGWGWLSGVLPGSKALPSSPANSPEPYQVAGAPRKCKGCTFIVAPTAPVTVAGKKATVAAGAGAAVVQAGKKSTAVAADSGATVYTANATRGQAAAGHGISQQQVKPGVWPIVAKAAGLLAGIGVVYWLVAGGGGTLLLAVFRRRKSDNQA